MKMNNLFFPVKRLLIQTFLAILSFILIFEAKAFCTVIDTTSIVIVGTVHNSTKKFTGDSLLNIIKRINPDLILIELDSSFFSSDMTIKPEFQQISLENTVISNYLKTNKVLIRPYDIEGRNKIYDQNNYFEQQSGLSNALNKAYKDSSIQGEASVYFDAIRRFDKINHAFASDYPFVINSTACMVAMECKQFYAFEGMIKIVSSLPELNKFVPYATFNRDFWIKRNNTMVKKILYWNKLLRPKTLLIICGYEHKTYLYNSLVSQEKANDFRLKDYWLY
jgi:hypothetical protein